MHYILCRLLDRVYWHWKYLLCALVTCGVLQAWHMYTRETETVPSRQIMQALTGIYTDKWTDRQTDWQTDRQTDRQTDKQTDRQADLQTGRPTGRLTDRQTGRPTDRWTDRQTNRQTGRQTDRQADRQTDRQTDNIRWYQWHFGHVQLLGVNMLKSQCSQEYYSTWTLHNCKAIKYIWMCLIQRLNRF